MRRDGAECAGMVPGGKQEGRPPNAPGWRRGPPSVRRDGAGWQNLRPSNAPGWRRGPLSAPGWCRANPYPTHDDPSKVEEPESLYYVALVGEAPGSSSG